MSGAGADSDHCPEIKQDYEYSLHSSIKVDCPGAEDFIYEWRVQQVLRDSKTVNVPFTKEVSSNFLFLSAHSLKGGLYKFTLTVTATPLGISKATSGYLRVRMPKLVATIDCGSKREMPWNQDIVLNGSRSSDPNDIDSSSAHSLLSFQWFCGPNRDTSCFQGMINDTQPVLRFPKGFLNRATTYQFVLLVTKESREAETSQTIAVRDGNFKPLCIR